MTTLKPWKQKLQLVRLTLIKEVSIEQKENLGELSLMLGRLWREVALEKTANLFVLRGL